MIYVNYMGYVNHMSYASYICKLYELHIYLKLLKMT